MSASRHAPATFLSYIAAHHGLKGQHRAAQFVGADGLQWIAQPSLLLMIGAVCCLGNIFVTVEKYLAILTPDVAPAGILDGDRDIVV